MHEMVCVVVELTNKHEIAGIMKESTNNARGCMSGRLASVKKSFLWYGAVGDIIWKKFRK